MIHSQLICAQCGCEDVTVFARNHDSSYSDRLRWAICASKPKTCVRCDKCGYEGETREFLRVRLTRDGLPAVRPEVQYIVSGRAYAGELRAKNGGKFKFVGVDGSEWIEIWLARWQFVLR